MSLDTAILIPSYNSNAQLDQLIDQIKSKIENQIIVVDDGSVNPINLKYNNVSLIRNITYKRSKKLKFQYRARY